jgi:hypothetical protein
MLGNPLRIQVHLLWGWIATRSVVVRSSPHLGTNARPESVPRFGLGAHMSTH